VTDTHWRLGHYEILEEIGRGGMGVIYRARQQHSRRIVAVKRIFAHDVNSHETLVRFRREAEAVASLDHPNILPIHEISESDEGLPFFSMKYATGGSLRAAAPALRTKPRECVRLMAKVARAIAYAHDKGVLHRDLQPGNILLDENDEPMVSDFGLARWLDQTSDLTRTLETLGTPGYIAPEQAERQAGDITSAADTYSLGAILFYLLTGRPPFVGANVLIVIHQAAATPAPRLRSLVPSLDRDLETIVGRCLEIDPKARYQSAGALADDLEHWLCHEPIRARRTGVFSRGVKCARRNPTTTMLVAALVVLAAAIVGVMVWKRGPLPPPVSGGIAVLPFENLSADPQNAFLADGVQDEILNDLAKIADLKVISRTSVMRYKSGAKQNLRQIASELGVAHVVEGSVQRVANRVRVTAQLIDAKTDMHLWVERYDRPLDDIFAIQSEIAKAIADELQAKLSPNEKKAIEQPPTNDLAAFDLYSRAKSLFLTVALRSTQVADVNKAIELLNEAVKRDPSFFNAYCQLSQAHEFLYADIGIGDHTAARLALAETALQSATRLRPDAGETHLARANYLYYGRRDYVGALAELESARRALPNDSRIFELTGYILRRRGEQEEGVRSLERAVELDPRNLYTLQQISNSYQRLGRYAEAIAALDRALSIVPDNVETKAFRDFIYLCWKGDTRPLHQTIDAILAQGPNAIASAADTWFECALAERDSVAAERALVASGESIMSETQIFLSRWFGEGLLARMTNDAARAHAAFQAARMEQEKIVQAEPDYGPALCVLAMIDAGLGRKELALEEGRRAITLAPVEKDVAVGSRVRQYFAITAAWAGDKDLALRQLDAGLRAPSVSSRLSYGALKLLPYWDPLRGDPRFEKLVEEAKKPIALK
jgi:TolB-like protein/Tfp pilus assembly protein PilF/tRNA A-37 threonylcarbamoyl transferase component Bud32